MDVEIHLLTISEKSHNENEAQIAMSALYNEFRDFVYNVVLKNIHFTLNREETASKVTSEVFLQIWKNPLKWEFDTNKHSSQEGGFKSYLSVIAKLKLFEELRLSQNSRENERNTIDEPDSEWKWSLLEEEYDYLDSDLQKKVNVIDECLYQFSEKKQDIIRMYFLFYSEGKNMSSEDIKLLENTFQTTWQNIRQVISRAKKEIKIAIENKAVSK